MFPKIDTKSEEIEAKQQANEALSNKIAELTGKLQEPRPPKILEADIDDILKSLGSIDGTHETKITFQCIIEFLKEYTLNLQNNTNPEALKVTLLSLLNTILLIFQETSTAIQKQTESESARAELTVKLQNVELELRAAQTSSAEFAASIGVMEKQLGEAEQAGENLTRELNKKASENADLKTKINQLEEELSQKTSLSKEQSELELALTKIQEEKDHLTMECSKVTRWLIETDKLIQADLAQMTAAAQLPDQFTAIEEAETKYTAHTDEAKTRKGKFETRLEELSYREKTIQQRLRAIKLLLLELPQASPSKITSADFAQLPSFKEMKNGGSNVASQMELDEVDVPKTIEDLPFEMNIGENELVTIRKFEAYISFHQGKGLEVIEKTLPFTSPRAQEKHYHALIQDLNEGIFLEKIKLALTILGAMRHGNHFQPQLSRDIGLVMKSRQVALTDSLGETTKKITDALSEIDIFGQIHETHKMIIKKAGKEGEVGNYCELSKLGQAASKLWSKDLLASEGITLSQLAAIHAYAEEQRSKKTHKLSEAIPA